MAEYWCDYGGNPKGYFCSHIKVFIFVYWQIHKERVIVIIPITKDEAQRLNKEYKIQFHRDNGISSTYSKPKKFFLTPVKRNIDALNEIRGVKSYKNKPNFRNKRVGV